MTEAAALILAWQRFPVQDSTVAVMSRAMETSRQFQISDWNTAILRAIGTASTIGNCGVARNRSRSVQPVTYGIT